jgi:hypothetical protein
MIFDNKLLAGTMPWFGLKTRGNRRFSAAQSGNLQNELKKYAQFAICRDEAVVNRIIALQSKEQLWNRVENI